MITLDYRTYNNRWGLSGIEYASWEGFAFALGYLANVDHYRNVTGNGDIDLHIERNDDQGAWGKEGRIHFYGSTAYLERVFPDWYNCKSAGVNNISYRINSNDYMYSLVEDFGFRLQTYRERRTMDIFPPTTDPFNCVWCVLEDHLRDIGWEDAEIDDIYEDYTAGWDE